jgi:hypothetical protein
MGSVAILDLNYLEDYISKQGKKAACKKFLKNPKISQEEHI